MKSVALYSHPGGHARGEVIEILPAGTNVYEKYDLKDLACKIKESINQERYVLRVHGKEKLVVIPKDRIYKLEKIA
ncbi:hypothetical protein [Leptospira sp. GIMC2001]|uniref:hypothetical protein n=1 Tax=Leptospira sp. GIMC2001 TaxID=1513297 RepID=UPI00234BB85B|nr:hypothetical protein [Leptospira sp. GIMC2001]WCL51450.1 hypothetical protein O4O04_20250 [Leptospira sp. GIMC2001]